ncbi:MAG: adenylate/guanylate [Planctomycetota bacterium]|nr:MAG: adenylate/guanylate [Planctomycetota bacterium]
MSSSERRTVAVLFSDLSGFTALSEEMDPEDVRDLMDALFARFRKAIEVRGGTVDKFIGDAVMAVFGAPVAHEDDSLRAVRAALAMQREIESFNRERGITLRLRVGVNLGEVLWGGVGGDRATAMGDAVNVAQRLEAAAPPGAVLVSDTVRVAASGFAQFRDAGEIALKGRKEPVRAHEATSEQAGSSESSILDGVGGALYGRTDELERLEAAWASGSSRVLVLEGDAGIGKSRLLAEFRRRVRAAGGGVAVFAGRALQESRLPLAPFAEIARQAAGTPENATGWFAGVLGEGGVAARHADLMALSLGFAISKDRKAAIDGAAARDETLPAWRAWFWALATSRRVLLCIEDLHWADSATSSLVEALAAAAPRGRALIVATTRPGDRPYVGDVVRLGELTAAAVRSVAEAVLREPLSDSLADFMQRQSGGNPYYAEELARHLRCRGLLTGRPLDLVASPDRLPETLLGILVSRIDAQSPACHEALKAASVHGRVFWPSLLPPDSAAGLEEARDAGLVFPSPASVLPGEPVLQFRHALLRDAAYGLLTRRDRAALHRLVAEALEPRAADAGRGALTLAAGHREAAGEPLEAARLYGAVAAEAAQSNPAESLSAAREAVRLDDGPAARVHLGFAHFLLGDLEPAAREAEAAMAFTGGTPAQRASASRLRADVALQAGRFEEALQAVSDGIAPEIGPEWDLQRRALRCRALVSLGRTEEALRETDDERQDAPPNRETDLARALLLGERGGTLMRLLRYEEALAAHRRTREIHLRLGNPLGVSTSANNIAAALMRLGLLEEARMGFEESLVSARRMGTRHGIATVLSNLGAILNQLGRWTEAEEKLQEARAIRAEMGGLVGVGAIAVNLARSLAGQGRLAESAAVLEEGRRQSAGMRDPLYWVRLTVQLAGIQLDRAEPDAGALLDEVDRRFSGDAAFSAEPAGRAVRATLLHHRVRHAMREGRSEEALALIGQVLPEFEQGVSPADAAELRLSLATLRPERALEEAAAAIAEARSSGSAAVLARVLAVVAGHFARAGRPDQAIASLAASKEAAAPVEAAVERLRILSAQADAHQALGEPAASAELRRQVDALAAATGGHGLVN